MSMSHHLILKCVFDIPTIYLDATSRKSLPITFAKLRETLCWMAMADLFATQEQPATHDEAPIDGPLADRLRPRQLDDVVGQEHLTGPEGAIGRMVAAGR